MMTQPAIRTGVGAKKKVGRTVLVTFTLTDEEQKLVEKAILFSPEKIDNYVLFDRLVRKAFIQTMKKFDSCECEVSSDSKLVNYVLSFAHCDFFSDRRGKKRMTRLPFNNTISSFLRRNPVYVSRLFKLCYLLASLKVLVSVMSKSLDSNKTEKQTALN